MSEVQGKIKVIGDVQIYGTFSKREFVLTTDEQYPQHIALELHQDKTTLIDSYNVDDDIKVSINIRGKEWVNPEGVAKYFNSLVGWRIEKVVNAPDIPLPPPAQDLNVAQNEPQDLPF